jgi:hypothetical protein
MSGLGDMWRDLAPEIGRTLGSTADHPDRGERVILRRPSTLEDLAGDVTPAVLQLASPALAGATSLALRLPSSGGMAGVLASGARLVLAGIEHTLTADAPADGATLTAAIAPPLPAPAAAGASVDVHPEGSYTLEDCKVHRRMRRDISRPLQADHFAVVMVPAKGAPVTPRLGDALELEDGTVGRVANQVISGGAFWKLQMGA